MPRLRTGTIHAKTGHLPSSNSGTRPGDTQGDAVKDYRKEEEKGETAAIQRASLSR